ncbi:MAG: hypothetical protein Q9159_002722 [Coniocarpon cinnabarinum]
MASQVTGVSLDPPVTVKVQIDGTNRRFKLSLRDLSASVFYSKVRDILQIPSNQTLILERFSDSSGAFVPVDACIPASYKQLYRAAKAKSKLRLRASLKQIDVQGHGASSSSQPALHTSATEEAAMETDTGNSTTQKQPFTSISDVPRLPSLAQILHEVDDADKAVSDKSLPAAPAAFEKSLLGRSFAAPRWQVCCNKCDQQVTNEHYHCSICDGGDYDLCEKCVQAGMVCEGEGHWMIKRTFKNGAFVNSTTRIVAPKPKEATQPVGTLEKHPDRSVPPMPGAFNPDIKSTVSDGHVDPSPQAQERICNACIRHLPETMSIVGVRYKCLDCPDFDYCGSCHATKKANHNHRFVPVYEPLPAVTGLRSRHVGVYCDGPSCKAQRNQSYIQGVRYKCTVCNDLDFCASCEADPGNEHNKTHPMLMCKTMIKDVSIQTYDSVDDHTTVLGDARRPRPFTRGPSTTVPPRYTPKAPSTETLPAYSAKPPTFPFRVPVKSSHGPPATPPPALPQVPMGELKAEFVQDAIPDGAMMRPGVVFTQTWTLKNPGPFAWPEGCSVRHVGGDYMLNVDQHSPSSVAELATAQESNSTMGKIVPGQTWHFSVQLKTPTRVGKHISYWRLKGPDGTPFGHKLWCDIQVQSAPTQPAASWLPGPPAGSLAQTQHERLLDYEMQLMLLEQQNKRRLLMKRQETEALQRAAENISPREQPLSPQQSDVEGRQESVAASRPAPKTEDGDRAMVFPKLEKESPASSTHQDMKKPASSPEAVASPSVATAASTETTSVVGEVSANDDFESDGSDEDDGFLTDEEYDILDASDEEIINGGTS